MRLIQVLAVLTLLGGCSLAAPDDNTLASALETGGSKQLSEISLCNEPGVARTCMAISRYRVEGGATTVDLRRAETIIEETDFKFGPATLRAVGPASQNNGVVCTGPGNTTVTDISPPTTDPEIKAKRAAALALVTREFAESGQDCVRYSRDGRRVFSHSVKPDGTVLDPTPTGEARAFQARDGYRLREQSPSQGAPPSPF